MIYKLEHDMEKICMKDGKPIVVNFCGYNCIIYKERYPNNRIALVLFSQDDNERFCVATTNLPEEELKENEVFIKSYSENEGMFSILKEAGVVESIGYVDTGYVYVPKCRLLA